MDMTRIQTCVDLHDWWLKAWKDRYMKGYWAALASFEYMEDVCHATSLGDLDMETATDFLERSTLLPITVEASIEEALQALSDRLNRLNEDDLKPKSAWVLAVSTEYSYFCDELNHNPEYGGLRLRDPRPWPFSDLRGTSAGPRRE